MLWLTEYVKFQVTFYMIFCVHCSVEAETLIANIDMNLTAAGTAGGMRIALVIIEGGAVHHHPVYQVYININLDCHLVVRLRRTLDIQMHRKYALQQCLLLIVKF